LTVQNGATILDERGCMFLSVGRSKYSKLQIYNPPSLTECETQTTSTEVTETKDENEDNILNNFCENLGEKVLS